MLNTNDYIRKEIQRQVVNQRYFEKKKKEKKLERKYDVRTLVVRKDANVRDLRIPHGNSIGGHSAADIQLL